MTEADSLRRARFIAEVTEGRGGADVLILDLREQTLVTDYFVIATANSRVHLRALGEAVQEAMKGERFHLHAREGDEYAKWILLDYGDVIVHLFLDESRAYYKLERMWASAPTVEFSAQRQA
jgi:ribosome-associated protein